MATSDRDVYDNLVTSNKLVDRFKKFAESDGQINGGKTTKLAKESWQGLKDLKKVDLSTIMDTAFTRSLEGKKVKKVPVDKKFCSLYLQFAAHEIAKKASGNPKLPLGDAAVIEWANKLAPEVNEAPVQHTTKTSKTGGVAKMTDTSQYTGAHKERFGADGQGKGIAGRENIADNSGYVGNYKGEGTYKK